jgi:predicted transcriptional regulator
LDHAAEQLSDELRLSRGDTGTALVEHLRNRHRLSVRILPQEVMPDLTRRLDLHARQVQLSEMLSTPSRNFQLAVQLARLEQQDAVEALAAGSGLARDGAARALFERHLYAYFAAAVIMPYRRFLRAAVATGYDLPVLQNRFGVSFEQLAHRLTTLQRVGERGLPFFMARVDAAGQFSKRLSGASGATFLDDEHSCPLWHVHRAFSRAGEWQVQRIDVDAAMPNDWVTISRTVGGAENDYVKFALTLGLETRFADELTQLRRSEAAPLPPTPTGRGCTRCYRLNCRQRSRLPEGAALRPDRMSEGAMPFNFAPADVGLN